MSDDFHCSFCGRNGKPVLVAGRGSVFICSECIELCRDIIGKFRLKGVKRRNKDAALHGDRV